MSEFWGTRLARWKFNLFPAYRGTGGRLPTSARRPGRSRLTATFQLGPEVVTGIRDELTRVPKLDRVLVVELVDRAGVVHAEVEKIIHVSHRGPEHAG